MKRAAIIKAVAAFSATAVIAAGSNATDIAAAGGLLGEFGLAGISLSLQQYTDSTEEALVELVAANASEDALVGILDEELDTTNARSLSLDDTDETEDIEAEEDTTEDETTEKEPVSEYENVGISIANNYVNIRKKPDTESKILGKLYKGSAATILATKGEWVKIKSGSVTGYINSEFLAIGFDAEELVDKYGTKWAEVTTTTLKVREKPSTEAITLTLIPIGESYQVLKEKDGWVKILLDEGDEGEESTKGWISGDYVNISVEFEHAISVKEEEAQKKREEEARKAEEEQLRKLAELQRQQQAAASKPATSVKPSGSTSRPSSSGSKDTGSVVASGNGSDIAAYAQKFVGNPYVYGGTSLTNGADCSGFTQSVYKHFGVNIPRTSGSQSGAGKKVSLDSLKAGDLIFYTNGSRVNHVAMYIGGGQVVHASSPKTGIKISNYKYRTPYCARRMVD